MTPTIEVSAGRARSSGRWQAAVRCLLGSAGLILLTFLCFRLKVDLATAGFVFLILLTGLSLMDNVVVSLVLTLVALVSLNYFFARPLFSFWIANPRDCLALTAFVTILLIVAALRHKRRRAVAALEESETAVERSEQERREAQADLSRVNRLMLVGELAASIAHEVNQPIAACVTNANACRRWLDARPPDVREAQLALERFVRDALHASEVIGRVRSLIKRVPPQRTLMDLNAAVLEVISLTEGQLQQHAIALRVNLGRGLPRVAADRVQVQQVILNLIVNAIEALLAVSDRPRCLSVNSGATPTDVGVEVRDSGVGLDSVDLERLFDSFYTTKVDGIGMGLAISRSIIEAHGGKLSAAPDPHRGAVFRFTLPREDRPA